MGQRRRGRGGARWRWLGGASLLLFGSLLFWRAAFWEAPPASPRLETFSQVTGPTLSASWLKITQEGQKVGYVHRNLSRSGRDYRFSEQVVMQINTMGVIQPLAMHTQADLGEDHSLRDFRFTLESNLFRFAARGRVNGKVMTLYAGTPGDERMTRVTLTERPYLGSGVVASLGRLNLNPGEERFYSLFDPASLGQRPVGIRFQGEEQVTVMGRRQQAKRFSVSFLGMRQDVWVDPEGIVLREEGMLGILMERVSREEALDASFGTGTSDLAAWAAVASPVVIEQPEKVKILKMRLEGLTKRRLDLDADRQSYRGGVLTVRREEPLRTSGGSERNPEELKAHLISTPLIQSDDERIQAQVREIIATGDDPARKAAKILDWTYRFLEKRPVLSVPNAVEILARGMGDCNEHAVLVAALARAAGIPTQVEAGLVYQRGRFYYHAWNVFHLERWGGWVTADATLGQFPADATHIRLVRGDADRQLDLVGLIGRLKIEQLEVVP